jgi:hypothetical protein
MKSLFLATAVASIATPAMTLDMNIRYDAREGLAYVNMWGPIVKGDAQKFRALITPALRSGYLLYQLNVFSRGGDLDEAVTRRQARSRRSDLPALRWAGNP